MCRVLTIAAAPANGNRHTGPVGALRFGFLVFVVLGVIVGVPSVLVVLTFFTTRALVRGRRRRMVAAAALAATLLALATYLALGMAGVTSYSDTACSRYTPPGFDEGSRTQSAGLWPPGLRCRFESGSGVATYQDDFDVVWVAVAMTSVFAATMGLVVVTVRYREGTVHFSSSSAPERAADVTTGSARLRQANLRLGWAPMSSGVAPSAR